MRFLRSLRGGRLVVALLVAVGILLMGARLLVNLYVDVLWFQEAGYLSVFLKRLVWIWGARVVAGLLVGVILFYNLRYVADTLGGIQIKRRFGNLEISEQLPRSYVIWGVLALSLFLGLWFGASVPDGQGIRVLLAAQGLEWGVTEPILGKDLSFYVFLLPLLRSGVGFLLIVTFLVFTVCTAGYAATGALRWGDDRRSGIEIGSQARIHLGSLVAVFVALLAVRFWLARYILLQSGNSSVQGIFGYADATARLPAYQTLAVLTVLAAALILWGAIRNQLVPAVAGLALVLGGGLLVAQFYPSLVQRFRVEPNELERETPYIQHNIEFTRMGFGLAGMSRERFEYEPPESVDWARAREQFDGLPVWTENALLTTFRELEARFPYYDFANVHVDRYEGPDGELVPVAISAREVDPGGISDPNWQNLHIRERYIVGMGVVASSAARKTPEGRTPMYVSAIPPEFSTELDAPPALRLLRPSVFFGSRRQLYAVINPSDSAFLAPDTMAGGTSGSDMARPGGPGEPGVDFPRGIGLDSFLRTFGLAWYLQEANLLFADEVQASSRFIFRRQVRERVRQVAPFFRYPEAPYPVVHEGRVVWILEGFTATRQFPLSSSHELRFRAPASYVRNSIKVTVDAVTGEVALYALPEEDPLLDAYARAFPGLIRPFEEMPEGLRDHLRYSQEYLNLQSGVLLQYHQESAPVFHGQQDVWALSNELAQNTSEVPYRPEYGIYRRPGVDREEFNLTTVFVPQGRQNLTAVMVGHLGADGGRELALYDVPVEDQVPGPRQVESIVEQDPTISQQFSLWRTGGSEVWTGHLHLVPVGSNLLYMEPVFLAAEADAIPQLQAFVVSDGNRVAMEPTLEQAVSVLAGDRERSETPRETAPEEEAARDLPLPGDPSRWPAEALDLLDRAEERLRAGDWQGFGQALEELRRLLDELSGEGGGSVDPSGGRE